jgi:hypothetical protein
VSDCGASVRVKSAVEAGDVIVKASEAVWVMEPEVAVNVTVPDCAAVPDAAVSETVAAVPGVSVSWAGWAVTPAGRPVIVTATFAANPFWGVASRDTVPGVPFAVRVVDVGVMVKEKSCGAGWTVMEACALAVWVPMVAVKLAMAVAAGAEGLAVNCTAVGVPGVSERVDGVRVTPVGKWDTATVAVPEVAEVSRRERL